MEGSGVLKHPQGFHTFGSHSPTSRGRPLRTKTSSPIAFCGVWLCVHVTIATVSSGAVKLDGLGSHGIGMHGTIENKASVEV
ncbi:hypothetical protein VTK73DRAFT_3160 [Phialemonium thermophilum]|uniref:Uncharacterized protein n=1 Tax=Phialemonium thermophilum TaxID=223376 RepID=A0ABR3X0N4_9PEZI